MQTTMSWSGVECIGPATVLQGRRVQITGSVVGVEMHADLILWADAWRERGRYGQIMDPVHFVRRDLRVHGWDHALAVAMMAAAVVALVTRIDVQDFDAYRFHRDTWWSWGVTIAICASLAGRRRWPLASFAVGLALMLPLELDKHRDSIAFFALAIAFYSIAAYLPMRRAWRGVAMLGALYIVLAVGGATIIAVKPIAGPTFFATGFALGRMRRRSRARQARHVQAAIERAAVEIETGDLAAAAQRLRMAQDLHDVVAHSLSVIAVQAGIGAHLIDREPAEADRALDAIRTTTATATSELARLVAILRDDSSTSDTPALSLTDVNCLVDQIRTTGVPVTLTIDGDIHAVPAGVSLAAYRIVQEALTNVVRHAGRAESTVTITVGNEIIELLIDDNGRGTTTPVDAEQRSGGNGLIGIRERAQMYAGDVRCGPRPGGGFRVHATLRTATNPTHLETPTNPIIPTVTEPHHGPIRRRPSPWLLDVLLALLMTMLAILQIFQSDPPAAGPQFSPNSHWSWTLRIGSAMMLAGRRRYPTVTLTGTWLIAATLALGNHQLGVTIFILCIALYTVASRASTRKLVAGAIGSLIGMTIVASTKPPDLTTGGAVWIGFMFVAVATAGYISRRDRERLHTELAEREDSAAAAARRAQLDITTERLHIADELGTVIARAMNTVATHAGTGTQTVSADPDAARTNLEAISTISRDALNDLRQLLKHLRTHTEPAIYQPINPTAALATVGDTT